MNVSDFPPSVWTDFVHLFLGKRLGSGIGREVYELSTDRTKVVKIETTTLASFQNVVEWTTWNDVVGTRVAKYLAPCQMISPCGIVLIQDRADPLRPEDEKARLPSFLCDFKRSNYGVIGGQVVCVDYGTNLAINHGALASRLQKPEWW